MGYSITAKTISGSEVDYYHYPSKEKERPLHKVLSVGHIKDTSPEIIKPYSLGNLLEAKSKLMSITGTISEIDFLDKCIMEAKESRQNIYITFN